MLIKHKYVRGARGGMVDAADLKSVVRMDVPVRARPGPPYHTHPYQYRPKP